MRGPPQAEGVARGQSGVHPACRASAWECAWAALTSRGDGSPAQGWGPGPEPRVLVRLAVEPCDYKTKCKSKEKKIMPKNWKLNETDEPVRLMAFR